MQSAQKPAQKVKTVNVIMAAKELAEMLSEDRSLVEKDVLQRGHELIEIFSDNSISGTFKNFNKMKIAALKLAVDDLSCGGMAIRTSTMGLSLTNDRIRSFIEPLGEAPPGTVIYSINLKDVFAFKNWRTDESMEIPQEDLNAAIYCLAWTWAELIPPVR